ncbi:MAG: hypothetical protein AAGB03_00985 [Pseudomonadota bacterium]
MKFASCGHQWFFKVREPAPETAGGGAMPTTPDGTPADKTAPAKDASPALEGAPGKGPSFAAAVAATDLDGLAAIGAKTAGGASAPAEGSDGQTAAAGSGSPLAAVFAALVVVAGTLIAALIFRNDLVRAWPPGEGLYRSIGISLDLSPYELAVSNQRKVVDGGYEYLLLEGTVRNGWREPLRAPGVVVTVSDARGRELDQWTIVLDADFLGAGAEQPFSVRRIYPEGAYQVVLAVEDGPPIP